MTTLTRSRGLDRYGSYSTSSFVHGASTCANLFRLRLLHRREKKGKGTTCTRKGVGTYEMVIDGGTSTCSDIEWEYCQVSMTSRRLGTLRRYLDEILGRSLGACKKFLRRGGGHSSVEPTRNGFSLRRFRHTIIHEKCLKGGVRPQIACRIDERPLAFGPC